MSQRFEAHSTLPRKVLYEILLPLAHQGVLMLMVPSHWMLQLSVVAAASLDPNPSFDCLQIPEPACTWQTQMAALMWFVSHEMRLKRIYAVLGLAPLPLPPVIDPAPCNCVPHEPRFDSSMLLPYVIMQPDTKSKCPAVTQASLV